MCSYCDRDNGHDIEHCAERLEDKFGTKPVSLREGETRDDHGHADIVSQQLAEADDETLADINAAEVITVGCPDGCGFEVQVARGAISATSCPDCERGLEELEDEREVRCDGGTEQTDSSFHVGRVTHESIARDLMEYLRENPDVCAEGNVIGWRWVRYADGEWRAIDYGGQDRLKFHVRGAVLEPETVREWLANKPVTLCPASEACRLRSGETTVWEDADQQDVFTDCERCFYCGQSDRSVGLECYETTDDGNCLLCSDCHEQWERAGEIVGRSIRTDGGYYCENCEDSGVIPPRDFADGDDCANCDGDPMNALPHKGRPHPPDYNCPDCGGDSDGGIDDAQTTLVTDGGTVQTATKQQELTAIDDAPEPRADSTLEREWNDLRKHADVNHESRPWETTHCDHDTDADRDYELLVSWTTNFCMAADAAYEWDRFTAVWAATEADDEREVRTDGGQSSNGTDHSCIRNFSCPQEQFSLPIGRIFPDGCTFAAYADPQRSQTPTTRLDWTMLSSHIINTESLPLNLGVHSRSFSDSSVHQRCSLQTDTERPEESQ